MFNIKTDEKLGRCLNLYAAQFAQLQLAAHGK